MKLLFSLLTGFVILVACVAAGVSIMRWHRKSIEERDEFKGKMKSSLRNLKRSFYGNFRTLFGGQEITEAA